MSYLVENQDFVLVLDHLKKMGISNAKVARDAGIDINRISNMKHGRTNVTTQEMTKIAAAYPIILDKLDELGIEINIQDLESLPANYSEDQGDELISKLIDNIEQKLTQRPDYVKEIVDEVKELREQLKEKDRHIQRLLNIVERLTPTGDGG